MPLLLFVSYRLPSYCCTVLGYQISSFGERSLAFLIFINNNGIVYCHLFTGTVSTHINCLSLILLDTYRYSNLDWLVRMVKVGVVPKGRNAWPRIFQRRQCIPFISFFLLLLWFLLSMSMQNQHNASVHHTADNDTSIDDDNEDENENGGNNTSSRKPTPTVELPLKLRETNIKILSTVINKFDLQFVDLTGNSNSNSTNNEHQHPHKGAYDEDGNPGYKYDEKALRKHTKTGTNHTFHITQEQAQCDLNDGTMQLLTNKVYVNLDAHKRAETRAKNGGKPRAKILCTIYTHEQNHKKLPTLYQTWGKKCDGFIAASNKTDPAFHTVNIPHEGEEKYFNMWQKVRSMWSYVYHNFYDEYDWFHMGGDDLYVLVENLRLYLESDEIQLAANGGVSGSDSGSGSGSEQPSEHEQMPLYLGCRFTLDNQTFNTGGPGYTLNKAALKALLMTYPTCSRSDDEACEEDVIVAECLQEQWSIYPYDTKDDQGGERYMHYTPDFHLKHKKEDWDLYSDVSIDVKEGLDCCANNSVAFHEIPGDVEMKRIHAILYGTCNKK